MIRYVAGFLFDQWGYVLLIEKKKPIWQKGLLNGIGGKIEPDESPIQAMIREFEEEAGFKVINWELFVKLYRLNEYEVNFFKAQANIDSLESPTEEQLVKVPYNYLKDCIPNLKWLIPLARDTSVKFPIYIEDIKGN